MVNTHQGGGTNSTFSFTEENSQVLRPLNCGTYLHMRVHVGLPVRIRCRLFNYFGICAVVTHQRALQSVDAGVGHDPLA